MKSQTKRVSHHYTLCQCTVWLCLYVCVCVCSLLSVQEPQSPPTGPQYSPRNTSSSWLRGWETGLCKDSGQAKVLPLSLSLCWCFSVHLSCSALIFFYFFFFTFFCLLYWKLVFLAGTVCSVLSDGQLIALVFVDL